MSTIGSSDPHLNRAGLDRLDGQVSLEELRGRDQGTGTRESTGLELRGTAPAADARPSADSGEDVLNASAWDGVPAGMRMLAGDHGFEARLGAMELSRSEEHTSELQSLMRSSYDVFCLKKKKQKIRTINQHITDTTTQSMRIEL